jgi:hypothetical protein
MTSLGLRPTPLTVIDASRKPPLISTGTVRELQSFSSVNKLMETLAAFCPIHSYSDASPLTPCLSMRPRS